MTMDSRLTGKKRSTDVTSAFGLLAACIVGVEIDGADFVRQMTDTAWGASADYAIAPLKGGLRWEGGEMSRDSAVLYIIRGTYPKGSFDDQLAPIKEVRNIQTQNSATFVDMALERLIAEVPERVKK